nr:competence type IV pilus minor pilin ComGE [Mammaliicoccus sp. Marseille-Q6498]
MKNNKGYVLIDLMLSIFIIILLGGTLLPLVSTLNKNLEKQHKQIKLYQTLYQTVQSKDHQYKFDINKTKYINTNEKICLEDVINHEKVCIQK